MQGRISSIVPLFLITIVSIVAVEALYQALEFFIFTPPEVSKKLSKVENSNIVSEQTVKREKPDFRIILKRNLFSRPGEKAATRAKEPAQETTATNSDELGIVLMGTISGAEKSRRAFILNKKTKEQELFSTGEVVEGALIKEIQRGKIVLSVNGKEEFLDMSEAAEMRPAYKVPATGNKSARPKTVEGNNRSEINPTPVTRRRIIRRPRTTRISPRPTAQ